MEVLLLFCAEMGLGSTSAAGGEGGRSIEPTYCKIVCKKFSERNCGARNGAPSLLSSYHPAQHN